MGSAMATCPLGKAVLGGGFDGNPPGPVPTPQLLSAGPTDYSADQGHFWAYRVIYYNPSTQIISIRASAICATVS
jgi:hypothetical protein